MGAAYIRVQSNMVGVAFLEIKERRIEYHHIRVAYLRMDHLTTDQKMRAKMKTTSHSARSPRRRVITQVAAVTSLFNGSS